MKTKGKLIGTLICIMIILSMVVTSIAQDTKKGTYYQIDNTNKIISRIDPKTDINTFIKELNISPSDIKIYKDKEKTKEVTSGYIVTGMVLECKILKDDYELSVVGDIDSDGEATQVDLSYIISDIVGVSQEKLDRAKYVSADLTGDGNVDQRDITKYTRFIVFGEWNIDKIYTEIPEASISDGTISFSEPIWNDGKASINITTNTDYQIEYQVNSTSGTWVREATAVNLQNNDIVYARLTDGIHTGDYTSITVVDTKKPEVTLTLTPTTSSIVAQAKVEYKQSSLANNVTYKFSIKESMQDDSAYVEKQNTTSNVCEITGLKQDTTYTVKVETKDIEKNTAKATETISTKVIPDASTEIGAITFGTTTWVNRKASIEIGTKTNYQIEYQVNSIVGTWTRLAKGAQSGTIKNLTHGDVIYARLYDGTNSGNYASYNIADRENPEIELSLLSTTSSIIVEAKAEDAQTGLADNATYKFSIKESMQDDSAYVEKQNTTSKRCEITGLKQDTTYTIKVEVEDIAGNVGKITQNKATISLSDALNQIGAVTFGDINWVNKKANIEISTTTNYQIEYQINNTIGEWVRVAKGVQSVELDNLEHGDVIYARLTDGTNAGTYVTKNIVDTENPEIELTLILTSETSAIKAVANAQDMQSGLPTNVTYKFSIKETAKDDSTYVEKQNTTESVCEITNLKQDVDYTVKVEVQDIAGNIGVATNTKKTKPITQLSISNVVFTYTPSTWTNTDVIARATLNGISLNTGERLQISTNGIDWEDGTSKTYTANGTLYVRVTDGSNIGSTAAAQITNIDKVKPTVTNVVSETKSLIFSAEDTLSGIIGYKVTETNTAPTNFDSIANTKTITDRKVTDLNENTTYYIWLKDEAGNVSIAKTAKTTAITQVSSANITFTYSPNNWTNGEVTATATLNGISLNTGEKMQVSTDGVNWTDGTSKTYSANGTLYVRVTDGLNIGSTAIGQITNIDKTKPIITSLTATTNKITFSAKDEQSGIIGYKVTRRCFYSANKL